MQTVLTTFEILSLADDLKKVNDRDVESVVNYLDGNKWKIEAIVEEDGYWYVYLDEYLQEEGEWVSSHIITKSVFSMQGAIAEAIDTVVRAIEEEEAR